MYGKANYQVYPEDYFSGSDVSIYFGDVWVDEVVAVNFSVMEYVQPIYGFNSYTWDAISRGARIVQGSFRLNFREANYLNKILMRQSATKNTLEYWKRYPNEQLSVDEFEETLLLHQNSPEEIRSQLKYKTKDEIKKMAEQLAKSAYGVELSDDTDPYFFKDYSRGTNVGFDIVVLYGSVLQSASKNKIYEERFLVPAATSYRIKNIQLTGLSQVVASDGSPVYEDYQFMARDLEPLK